MFQKKPSASEVDDVQYRRAKTWQIICYACNAFVGMSVYSLIGMASYSASIGSVKASRMRASIRMMPTVAVVMP